MARTRARCIHVRRDAELLASLFTNSIESAVVASLILAHATQGRGPLDWPFLLLWAVALPGLYTSRAARVKLHLEEKRALVAVEHATAEAEGELPAMLIDGTVRLVSVDYLLGLPTKQPVLRHQDLPPGALLPPAEAQALLSAGAVAALSYAWLSPAHPDPTAYHLRAVVDWLVTHPEIKAVFWDFLCLPQKDPSDLLQGRTDEEAARFGRALGVMLNLYASPRTRVLQHKNVPIKSVLPAFMTGSKELNLRPYDKRGWPTCEEFTALSVNVRDKVADIGRGHYVPSSGNRVTPEELRGLLSKTHFTGKGDEEIVMRLYTDFFTTACALDEAVARANLKELNDLRSTESGVKVKAGEGALTQTWKGWKRALF